MLFWTPRILCILLALFLSLFALDVFEEGVGMWRTMAALLIHLVPVYVIVIALLVSWKQEWLGAVLFFGLAIFYLIWGHGRVHWSAKLAIAGPLAMIGVFFLLNWTYRKQLRNPSSE
jgi:hypothetical protein